MNKRKDFFKGFIEGLKEFGLSINILVITSLLTIVYVLGVGVTSIIAKALGKHFLNTQLAKNQDTYWTELNLSKKEIEEYYKQF